MPYPSQYTVILDSGSTSTSNFWYVGDFRLLTVSFSSRGSLGPSRLTIEGSNVDGFNASLGSLPASTAAASLISGINLVGVTPGMVTFDPPGYRWVRATVAPGNQSVASSLTVTFVGKTF